MDKKLTFSGFTHYIIGLSSGNYLFRDKDKFEIIEWYNKITYSLISGLELAYNDLQKIPYEDKIFGLKKIKYR